MSFFDDKQEELQQELESWVDTPFRHHQGVKGTGVDCIHLVARVLEHFGFGPFRIPDYARDWHLHQEHELLRDGIFAQLDVDEIPLDEEPKNGDILLYKFGRAAAHSGIYFDKYIYHAIIGVGVVKMRFDKVLQIGKHKVPLSHTLRLRGGVPSQ